MEGFAEPSEKYKDVLQNPAWFPSGVEGKPVARTRKMQRFMLNLALFMNDTNRSMIIMKVSVCDMEICVSIIQFIIFITKFFI